MGRVALSVDSRANGAVLVDDAARPPRPRRTWSSREELASAVVERIEGFYNTVRRNTGLEYRSPNDFEDLHTVAVAAARTPNRICPGKRVRLP
jgi:sugar (pentulose or hexulose) kinase